MSVFCVQGDVKEHVASFMLQDLRRYQMFDSSATRPYTVSAMACWKRASDLGYITLDANKKVCCLIRPTNNSMHTITLMPLCFNNTILVAIKPVAVPMSSLQRSSC